MFTITKTQICTLMKLKIFTTLIIVSLLTALLFSSCQKKYLDDDFPNCLNNLIGEYDDGQCSNRLYSYDYMGDKVYLVTSECFDDCSSLYDETCDYLCRPTGCINGTGDGKCPDFFDEAENRELLWEED